MKEYRELRDDPKVNIIRTKEDWLQYLDSDENVLRGLEQETVQKFTDSLVLNGGIGGFRYDLIQDVLTFQKFRRLLWAFGIDVEIFKDYEGYYCSGKATCKPQSGSICIGENC
jgi:hypothetical protein